MGEHTLTCDEFFGIAIYWVDFTIKNGTYENTCPGGTAIEAGDTSTVTIANGTTIIAACDALVCDGRNTVYVYGKIFGGNNCVWGYGPSNNITLDGAYIESDTYAVYQNPYTKDSPFDRAGSTYVIEDSTIIAGNDVQGVYLYNYTGIATTNHKLTIKNSDISAGIGVYLSCTDATIDGESTKIEYTNTTGNSIYFGHDGSGTVGSLAINAGEIVGPIGVQDPGSATNEADILVNGGFFTEPVNVSYLSSEFKYMVHDGLYYSYYETLAEALQAAAPDGTVEAIAIPGRVIHTVTVVYGNGTADTVNTYVDGETINLPAAPTREGYAFLGWSDGDPPRRPARAMPSSAGATATKPTTPGTSTLSPRTPPSPPCGKKNTT